MRKVIFLIPSLFIFSQYWLAFSFFFITVYWLVRSHKIDRIYFFIALLFIFSMSIHLLFFGDDDKIIFFTLEVIILCAFIPGVISTSFTNVNELLENINFAIYIHLILFFLQLFSFYIINVDLDYGLLLGGPPHRSSYEGFLYRPTGIFAEPSIYSIHILTLIVLQFLIRNENTPLVYISLFSMLLSGSSFAIICIILYLLLTIKLNKIFSMVLILCLFLPLIVDHIIWRMNLMFSGSDGSSSYKKELIESFFDKDIFHAGYGLIGYTENAPPYLQSLFDVTIFGTSFLVFGFWLGIILNLLLCYLFLNNKMGLRNKLLVLLPCFKLTFIFPFFWVYVYLINKVFRLRIIKIPKFYQTNSLVNNEIYKRRS